MINRIHDASIPIAEELALAAGLFCAAFTALRIALQFAGVW